MLSDRSLGFHCCPSAEILLPAAPTHGSCEANLCGAAIDVDHHHAFDLTTPSGFVSLGGGGIVEMTSDFVGSLKPKKTNLQDSRKFSGLFDPCFVSRFLGDGHS